MISEGELKLISSWTTPTSLDEATLNSEEIKPVAIAIIELRLSEGISKGARE